MSNLKQITIKNNYWIEYGFLSKWPGQVLSIEFVLSIKRKTFSMGLTLFTCNLFWLEIAKLD